MRSSTPPDLAGRCRRCFLPTALCLCDAIPAVEVDFELLVLRHSQETMRSTNTARPAALAIPSCRIVEYGRPHERMDLELLAAEGNWLLFPSDSPRPLPPGRPRRLLILDGSWSQARHMYQRLPPLWSLPRLSLSPRPEPVTRLRRPPNVHAMSTLEAIARAIELLEGEATAEPLYELHRSMVARVLKARGY